MQVQSTDWRQVLHNKSSLHIKVEEKDKNKVLQATKKDKQIQSSTKQINKNGLFFIINYSLPLQKLFGDVNKNGPVYETPRLPNGIADSQ